MPAEVDQLLMLLRRRLFELPPGRLGGSQEPNASASNNQQRYSDKSNETADTDSNITLKPISASRAKLALIETLRDVAFVHSIPFAALILPTLFTFRTSQARSVASCASGCRRTIIASLS